MVKEELRSLVDQVSNHQIDRRDFIRRATALGLTVPFASLLLQQIPAAAQAESGPPGTVPGTKSPTSDEATAAIKEHFKIEEAKKKGGDVIYAYPSDIHTLNALIANDSQSFTIIAGPLFEALTGTSPVDGSVVPALADYWEFGADGLTYTFHLRKNVKWHDGQPFTADDVQFSFDSMANPKLNNSYRESILDETESWKKVDDYTFEIKAKRKTVTFLWDVPGVVLVMPKHIWESVPLDKWQNDDGSTGKDPKKVVGTGPFKLKEWVVGDHVTVVRNDQYYGDIPNIDSFIYHVVPDAATQVQALKTGEADIADAIPFAQVDDIKNTPGLDVNAFPTYTFWFYLYNLDPSVTPLFQDKQVRQALFWALDRESLVKNITFGFAEVAQGTQPKVSIAYAPDKITTHYTYDPDKAKQLLDAAGWKVGSGGTREKDGVKFEFEWLCPNGSAEYEQMLADFQQKYKAIGVKMTPKFVDFPTLLDIQDSHKFQVMNLAFSWDPTGNQGPMFRCDAYNGGFNYMKYCNPEYDKLDDQQKVEFDRQKRIDLLIEQSNIINEDLPVGVLIFRDQRVGYASKLHNFIPNANGGEWWTLSYIWSE